MKYNINVIKSVWGRWRKPSRATLAAIASQSAMYEAGGEVKRRAQALDSAVRQHVTRLEADRHDLLTMAKTVVRLRDMNVHPRPSSEIINALRDTIARVERSKP
jgi:predicted TPR repeat methyltransferase